MGMAPNDSGELANQERRLPARHAAMGQKRRKRSEAAWAIAGVALIGFLMCAVVAALYPIWS